MNLLECNQLEISISRLEISISRVAIGGIFKCGREFYMKIAGNRLYIREAFCDIVNLNTGYVSSMLHSTLVSLYPVNNTLTIKIKEEKEQK